MLRKLAAQLICVPGADFTLPVWICRIVEAQFKAIPVSLSSDGTTIEHIDHDFFDDLELAFLGRISAPGQGRQPHASAYCSALYADSFNPAESEAFLATIDYRALDWEHAVSQVAKVRNTPRMQGLAGLTE